MRRSRTLLVSLLFCLPALGQEAWLQPGTTILANPMNFPNDFHPAQVVRYNPDSDTYLIRFQSGPYAVGRGEYTLSASKLKPAPSPPAQAPTATVTNPTPAPNVPSSVGFGPQAGQQVLANPMNFPNDFHPAQIVKYNADSDTYLVRFTSGPYAKGPGEYTLSSSRIRPAENPAAPAPGVAKATPAPAQPSPPVTPAPAPTTNSKPESTWEQMWREREQTIAAQKNQAPAGKVAGATPFQGLYLRHEQTFQGTALNYREDHFYFFPDGRVYHDVPPEGPSRFQWDKAQQETPQLCGYYGVNGNEITFSWPTGGYTWMLKKNGGGYEMNYAPTVKVDQFPANARLSGTYQRGDITAGTGQPTLSTAFTYTFSPDGTVVMNDMKGADTATVTATVRERDSGTYTLSGNDLEIRSGAGVWRCTAFPQWNGGPPSQTPARISLDGSLLERRR